MSPPPSAADPKGPLLDPVLRALADPTRRQVVELLAGGERRPGELSVELRTTAPTMSKHLRVLLDAGIVEDRRDPVDARGRLFVLRRGPVVAVRAWLDQLGAHWDEQLGAFKAHADRAHKTTPPHEGIRPHEGGRT